MEGYQAYIQSLRDRNAMIAHNWAQRTSDIGGFLGSKLGGGVRATTGKTGKALTAGIPGTLATTDDKNRYLATAELTGNKELANIPEPVVPVTDREYSALKKDLDRKKITPEEYDVRRNELDQRNPEVDPTMQVEDYKPLLREQEKLRKYDAKESKVEEKFNQMWMRDPKGTSESFKQNLLNPKQVMKIEETLAADIEDTGITLPSITEATRKLQDDVSKFSASLPYTKTGGRITANPAMNDAAQALVTNANSYTKLLDTYIGNINGSVTSMDSEIEKLQTVLRATPKQRLADPNMPDNTTEITMKIEELANKIEARNRFKSDLVEAKNNVELLKTIKSPIGSPIINVIDTTTPRYLQSIVDDLEMAKKELTDETAIENLDAVKAILTVGNDKISNLNMLDPNEIIRFTNDLSYKTSVSALEKQINEDQQAIRDGGIYDPETKETNPLSTAEATALGARIELLQPVLNKLKSFGQAVPVLKTMTKEQRRIAEALTETNIQYDNLASEADNLEIKTPAEAVIKKNKIFKDSTDVSLLNKEIRSAQKEIDRLTPKGTPTTPEEIEAAESNKLIIEQKQKEIKDKQSQVADINGDISDNRLALRQREDYEDRLQKMDAHRTSLLMDMNKTEKVGIKPSLTGFTYEMTRKSQFNDEQKLKDMADDKLTGTKEYYDLKTVAQRKKEKADAMLERFYRQDKVIEAKKEAVDTRISNIRQSPEYRESIKNLGRERFLKVHPIGSVEWWKTIGLKEEQAKKYLTFEQKKELLEIDRTEKLALENARNDNELKRIKAEYAEKRNLVAFADKSDVIAKQWTTRTDELKKAIRAKKTDINDAIVSDINNSGVKIKAKSSNKDLDRTQRESFGAQLWANVNKELGTDKVLELTSKGTGTPAELAKLQTYDTDELYLTDDQVDNIMAGLERSYTFENRKTFMETLKNLFRR